MLSLRIFRKFPSIINGVINTSISWVEMSSLPIDRLKFLAISNGVINVSMIVGGSVVINLSMILEWNAFSTYL